MFQLKGSPLRLPMHLVCMAVLPLLLSCSSDDTAGSSVNPTVPPGSDPGLDGPASDGSPQSPAASPEPPNEASQEVAVSGREFQCGPSVVPGPGRNHVRRLTKTEYANSVLDVFGVDVSSMVAALPDGFPTQQEFDNRSQGATRGHVSQFAAIAEQVASSLDLGAVVPCTEYGAACQSSVYDEVGLKLFRAPLGAEERSALDKVFEAGAQAGAAFEEAARVVLETMLQSPRFLYRLENEVGDGTVRDLDGYELASRLSFSLWQSTPDDELLAAAGNGSLVTDAGLEAQVERLLNDPRALSAGANFLDDWMDLHRTEDAGLITARRPDFDETLLPDFRAETHNAFRYVYENQSPFMSLHNLQLTSITPKLAAYYGLEPQAEEAQYDLQAVPERGGLLTQASMGSLGGPSSSTVIRGLHLLDEVLCGSMTDPPPGVVASPTPPTAGQSVREVSQGRVDDPPCGVCHSQFEPMVWPLVRFDLAGAYSEEDEFGTPLPEDGFVVFPDTRERVEFQNLREMTDALAAAPRVRDCALIKLNEYFSARSTAAGDCESLAQARSQVESGGASYQEMVSALVMTPNFRQLLTEPTSD